MAEHTTVPVDDTSTGSGGRRALLAAGAGAALGAVGVALAGPAEAAPGQPLLLGRANTSGASATSVTSSTTGSALSATASAGHGLIGIAKLNSKFGILGRNDATTAAGGGAVLGDGRANIGVMGRTSNQATYAIVGLNSSPAVGPAGAVVGDGTANPGVVAFTEAPAGSAPALYAHGSGGWAAWLDGETRVDGGLLVGVPGATAGSTSYRPVASTEAVVHTTSGRATLDAAGTVTVTLPKTFTDAATVTAAGAVVQLTAMDIAMPGLFATVTATAVTITGGTPAGSVSWTLTAPRRAAPAVLAAVASPARTTPAARAPQRPIR